eukprot:GILJ01001368.1.p1 GENE.GILJ01001368.1~~GILJ01001368.1.p1  ORF type:complete len:284 (-),score=65.86 GILJ01001368.1:128-979(-)
MSHKMLMDKLLLIEKQCGVKSNNIETKEKGGDEFLKLKHMLAEGIRAALQAVRERNAYYQKYGGSKETIEKSARIRDQVRQLDSQFAELKRVQLNQARKPKKYGGEEEISKRAKQVMLFAQHLSDLKDMERNGTNLKLALPTLTDGRKLLFNGASGDAGFSRGGGAAGEHKERELTDEESSAMQRWKETDQEMDAMIDDIDKGVQLLGNIAIQIKDTTEKQSMMIDELNHQADKTGAHMENVNKKMKKLLASVRSGDKFCVDVICLCILLGLAGFMYNQISSG